MKTWARAQCPQLDECRIIGHRASGTMGFFARVAVMGCRQVVWSNAPPLPPRPLAFLFIVDISDEESRARPNGKLLIRI